ncbi:MAG: hypothetical protein B9S37_00285 [Verrucomicrobiia bacterium Tous-C3TDCM]|nr:MAG: hypothetical protein B9S37_00285 [Verrucomicrobiae bacterium Tous-C3TDCM]PAZ07373.1 MAG: hypothetical protein CAK88_01335 [Verrucomicrobiae bacterium AMD-G2]
MKFSKRNLFLSFKKTIKKSTGKRKSKLAESDLMKYLSGVDSNLVKITSSNALSHQEMLISKD